MEKWLLIVVSLVALKAVIGFRFPWEKCEGCGQKWKNHTKNRKEITND